MNDENLKDKLIESEGKKLPKGQESPFAWWFPNEPGQVDIKIKVNKQKDNFIYEENLLHRHQFNLDEITENQNLFFKIKSSRNHRVYLIFVYTKIEGPTKILEFREQKFTIKSQTKFNLLFSNKDEESSEKSSKNSGTLANAEDAISQ